MQKKHVASQCKMSREHGIVVNSMYWFELFLCFCIYAVSYPINPEKRSTRI